MPVVTWEMSNPPITGALDVEMTDEWRAEISALSIEPPPATDRSEEKSRVFYQGGKLA